MIKSLYQSSVYLGICSQAVLATVSAIYCTKPFNPKYLAIFPAFCIYEFLADGTTILLNVKSVIGNEIENLTTIVELVYFSFLLTNIVVSSITKKIVWVLVGLFCIYFFCLLHKVGIFQYAEPAVFFQSLILIYPSLVFMKEIFTHIGSRNIKKEPAFWIITGVLFYYGSILPLILCRWYFVIKGLREMHTDIYIVNNFSSIASNILFVKGCTCRKKK